MKAVLKILLGVFAILAIGILSIPLEALPGSAKSAERRLAERTAQIVEDHQLSWAQVSIDGQKAIIDGEAPSEEARDAAIHLIRGGVVIGGITVADTTGLSVAEQFPIADPFIWIAERQGASLAFSGYAPSREARDQIYRLAQTSFSNTELSGDLDIAGGGPPEDQWITAAAISLRALARLEEGAIEANGPVFTLSGKARSEERAAGLRDLINSLPDNITGRTNIDILPPASEETAIAAGEPAVEGQSEAPQKETTDSDASPDASGVDVNDQCRQALLAAINLQPIGFARGRRDINAANRPQLEDIAQKLIACPQFRLEITGHTDSTGAEPRNQRLSRHRAETILAYLTAAGAPKDRLEARGVGSAEPVATNTTAEGRERNRRIEIDLIFDP